MSGLRKAGRQEQSRGISGVQKPGGKRDLAPPWRRYQKGARDAGTAGITAGGRGKADDTEQGTEPEEGAWQPSARTSHDTTENSAGAPSVCQDQSYCYQVRKLQGAS